MVQEQERALTAAPAAVASPAHGAAAATAAKKKKKPSRLAMIRLGYEQLVSTVVRPPRVAYSVSDLGMSCRRINGAFVERTDFDVENARGEVLRCSKWTPNTASRRYILYLHSNSSCRLAVVRSPLLPTAASVGATLVSFDFAGCGISDGDVVTLGANEKDDVAKVVAEITRADPGAQIVLWGRSMGAASALLYCEAHGDDSVRALVLDSPRVRRRRPSEGRAIRRPRAQVPLAPAARGRRGQARRAARAALRRPVPPLLPPPVRHQADARRQRHARHVRRRGARRDAARALRLRDARRPGGAGDARRAPRGHVGGAGVFLLVSPE